MVERIGWKEFHETGLLLFINSFLHIFGLSIVVCENDNGEVIEVYPAKVDYKGFSEKATDMAYWRVNKYLKNNEKSRG